MAEICLNCNHEITDNFCGNCGQKKYKRIDRKYLWDEIQYTVLHTNKGFLHSVKSTFKNPGKTAREFVDGNRVNHYKPILLVFVLSGISAFISYKILHLNDLMTAYFEVQHMNSQFMADMMAFFTSYHSIVMLVLIPFFALATKIAFRKWGHNYYEHVVVNAYILSFYTMVNSLLLYPIMYFGNLKPESTILLSQLSMLLVPLVLFWFFRNFYPEKSAKSIVLKVLAVLGVTFLGYILAMIVLIFVGFVFAAVQGPESLEYIKPK